MLMYINIAAWEKEYLANEVDRNEKKRERFKEKVYLVYRGHGFNNTGAYHYRHNVDGKKSVIRHR